MSFTFGFNGDDIEDDEQNHEEQDDALVGQISDYTISDQDLESKHSATLPPQRHSLEELLSSLPSQISYNTLPVPSARPSSPKADRERSSSHEEAQTKTTPSTPAAIQRRSLFDIRAQLMAEADDDADTLLSGLENGDLTSGIYEGGFKTWECSLDLASLVVTDLVDFTTTKNWHVLELGAGSAVPSLALLQASFSASTSMTKHQKQQQQHQQQQQQGRSRGGSLRFTLCDYNEDVLKLCTAPNVLLNYYYYHHHQMRESSEQSTSASPNEEQQEQEEEGDLDIEELGGETFVADTVRDLRSRNISFDFISGGWGDSFLDLVPGPPPPRGDADADADVPSDESLLILASETIYSPASIEVFAHTLVNLLRRYPRGMAKAWVAAKKVYFGVGGGVDDFLREIGRHGAKSTTLLETKDTGVGRVVLEITV
ncbi:hypothetical protein LTR23_000285 [Exophiala sp. CCFEE 6169]|nr:hypothetical protein LTR23_000285 [Chaetothyriales sp. CCFEE 6169]